MDINEYLRNDFPPISDQEWKDQVMRDLRGKDFEETLVWTDEDGVKHQPYYRKSDIENSPLVDEIKVAQRISKGWELIEKLPPATDPLALWVESGEIVGALELSHSETYVLNLEVYKNKGATAVQELAFGLQHLLEYMDRLTTAGLSAQAAAEAIEIRLPVGNSYFIELAKFRVFRYLLNKIFRAYDLNHQTKITAVGSMYYMSHQDVHSNLLRGSTQAMSAILGGCDALYLPAFDELDKASSLGSRMARNIQLILKEESHFDKIIDPASGSYYVESIGAQYAELAWNEFLKMEEMGGLMACIKSNYVEESLEASRSRRIKLYKEGSRKMLGVNAYENPLGINLEPRESLSILSKEIRA